ncbi:uncharacterized protein NFIA_102520 [Aspergillus fischeri NRRL 181]|uniref:Uncharacterized protein n=1 Tax=Neosartorya fischeri (strain ATCC 1020 / DSM 3700 / CBS 544.65 / FGSC A1164 / JCM 1740 / NRRL 181 / WB 181) TaxID=331117 RepID=A1CVW5_NEOFI|nr:uncharacterized protein NFIA_102520 [Aspergillus fischeri NRRL 181]EAW24767.1 hypothetical protein NFIA_102520 [Aspergillus fischeri NRRL 181]
MFLWRAEELTLLDGADASDSPWLLYRGVQNKDVADIAYYVESQNRLNIAMAAVSLHITGEAALRSGLVWLLGNAPVQMVDVGDEDQLRGFQALSGDYTLEKESAV